MSVSRRTALRGLSTLGLAGLAPAALAASAPTAPDPAMSHGASHASFSIGDAKVTAILDATFMLPPGAIGTNVSPESVTALLESRGLPTDRVAASVNVVMVEVGDQRVLVDTGTGGPGTMAEGGMLMKTMGALGVEPGSIDKVVLSHWHGDHVGGAARNGRPAYPNATYHLSAAEKQFLDSAPAGDERVQGTKQALAPVMGGLQTYADGDILAPGLTAIAAPGHTPGHFVFLLEMNGERLMLGSDTANHPVAFFERPEWGFGFDMDVEQTVATRRRVLGRAADERIPYWSTHLPFPGVGAVSRDGAGFRFTPLPMM